MNKINIGIISIVVLLTSFNLKAADTFLTIDLDGRVIPQIENLPAGPYRAMVTQGYELSTRTFAIIGPEVADPLKRYAGNNLACTSCHEVGGTKSYAIPWIGAAATFPQYRARSDKISTLQERINGCMQRSMNGRSLPLDSSEMTAFTSYMTYLSTGVPIGATIQGARLMQSTPPDRRANTENGNTIYAAKCSMCHGADGLGMRVGQIGDAKGYTFPPLWGPDSFNNGAGMNRLLTAMGFIRQNMPLGASHTATLLNDDEAYDVAAFVLSNSRPMKLNLESDFPARWNKPIDSPYPPYMLGASADQHRYGPFAPLAKKQKEMKELQLTTIR
jgi:thiosulfate dehydrogenase